MSRLGLSHFTSALVLTASGLLAAQVPPTPGAQADALRITQVTRLDGTQQIWEISRARLQALPPWNPGATPLPLSLSAAVDVAETWVARQNPEVKRWMTVNADLRPIASTAGRGLIPAQAVAAWYYRVQLAPEISSPEVLLPGPAGDARRFTVVVLLDGSIVEPRSANAPTPSTQVARPGQTTPAGPRLVPGTSDVYIAGAGVVAPRPTSTPRPAYTAEAKRRVIQGTVVMQCVVDTDGRCQDITVTRSLDSVYGLDQQAIRTAGEWRFTPGTLNGKPVKVQILVEFDFNLR